MPAPSTFIPDKAPKTFVPDAPSTFVADEGPTELNLSARNVPDRTATTAGGPRVSLPDAGVATKSFFGDVSSGIGDLVTHPGVELPNVVPSPQTVQKALNAARFAQQYETEGGAPAPVDFEQAPGTAAKVISGGAEGLNELASGVANFFTSGPGMLQLGAAATPVAPAVYLKWTVDMLNAGFTSVGQAWDAFQKSDWKNASKNTAVAFGSFLGAGAAARHGYKEAAPLIDAVPRGDLRDVRLDEARQKALEATMPIQDRVSPVEVEILRQNNAPATAAAVEAIGRQVPRLTTEESTTALRELLPEDVTTDIRKQPTEIGGPNALDKTTTRPVQPLREEPLKGEAEVPAEVSRSEADVGRDKTVTAETAVETRSLPDDLPTLKKLKSEMEARLNEIEASEHELVKGTLLEGQSRWSAIKQSVDLITDINTKISELERVKTKLSKAGKAEAQTPLTKESESVQSGGVKAKAPWEMTKSEYERSHRLTRKQTETLYFDELNERAKLRARDEAKKADVPEDDLWAYTFDEYGHFTDKKRPQEIPHETEVYDAVRKGKPVPPEVLKDYPDLSPKTAEAAKAASANPSPPQTVSTDGRGVEQSNLPDSYISEIRDEAARAKTTLENQKRFRAKWIKVLTNQIINGSVPESALKNPIVEVVSTTVLKGSGESTSYHPTITIREDGRQVWRGTSNEFDYANPLEVIYGDNLIKVSKERNSTIYSLSKPESPASSPPTPKIEGMGGAIPEEFKPSQSLPTANKNASIDADRVARGESPLMSAMRKSDPELWDQAMAVIENDWQAADKLIARHKQEPFTPTDTDLIVLLQRRTDLKNTFAKLSREYAEALDEGRGEMASAAKASRDAILDQLRELEAIVGRGDTAMGTMQGRAFRARRLAMNEDYSLASLIVDREANLKRKLKPEEVAELEKISQDQARVSAELEKKEAEIAARQEAIEAREIAAKIAEESKAETKYSPYILKLAEDIVKSWDARADAARARLREKWSRTSTGLDPTILVDLSEIGVSHLAHAGLDFAKWTARMVDDLGEFAERAKPYFKEAFDRARKLAEQEKSKRAGPKKDEVSKAIADRKPPEFAENVVNRLAKKFAKNPKLDFSYAARQLARFFYEKGITKPLELVDAVHAELVKAMPDLTKREAMDSLSGYGRFTPLKKDAISVGLRDVNGQLQQIAKLEDMAEGQAPKKTGHERRVPSDEERRLIKQVEEEKKKGGYDVTDPETQLRSAMQAAQRRMENSIKDLLHEIETRTRIVKNKRKLELNPELKALKDRLDFIREVHREVFKPSPLTDAQRLVKWKELAQDKIEEYQQRLVNRDFKVKQRPPPPRLDKEAIQLRYELHKVHKALMDMRLKDELKNQSRIQKIASGTANVIRFARAVMTGGEFSAVLRQGGFTALSHPVLSAKALKPMFKALMSEEAQFKINEEIQTRPNAPLYEKNKLQFTESGVRLSTMEEHYMFRVSEKLEKNLLAKYPIKFLNAFQRAYTTYLNKIRADSFDTLLDTYGDTPEMQKQIANLINVATGRGSTAVGRYVGPGLNTVFFAPRYSISRLQLLTGQPAWRGNLETRKMVAQEYARALAGAAVVYSLGLMAGGKVEDDPRSSDFGKIRFGNTRIDPLFGLAQWTRQLAEQGTGTKVNKRGEVRPLRDTYRIGGYLRKRNAVEPSGTDEAMRFIQGKFAPVPAVAANFLAGKDYQGRKFNFKNELINVSMPITYGDIYNAMQDQGVERGAAIAVLALFGMGVQVYDENAKREE